MFVLLSSESESNFTLHQSSQTLFECLKNIKGDEQSGIPWIVWLLENPDSIFPLPGKINLYNHDCLHILLERDISLFDEAFVVGFTMGSDIRTNRFHLAVFKIVSSLFYPQEYKFNQLHFKLFDLAFDYGRSLKVKNLNQFNFKAYENKTLSEFRKYLGIDLSEVKQCFDLVVKV